MTGKLGAGLYNMDYTESINTLTKWAELGIFIQEHDYNNAFNDAKN